MLMYFIIVFCIALFYFLSLVAYKNKILSAGMGRILYQGVHGNILRRSKMLKRPMKQLDLQTFLDFHVNNNFSGYITLNNFLFFFLFSLSL